MKKIICIFLGWLFTSACQKNSDNLDSGRDAQLVGNQKVLDNLMKNGDSLIVSREVFHWIYFKKEDDLNNFLAEVILENFEKVDANRIEGEFPFQLQIKRIDYVDKQSVDKYVLYLFDLAVKHNGDYDGWETSVEAE